MTASMTAQRPPAIRRNPGGVDQVLVRSAVEPTGRNRTGFLAVLAGSSYLASVVLHAGLVLVLALLMFHLPSQEQSISTLASVGDDAAVPGLFVTPDVRVVAVEPIETRLPRAIANGPTGSAGLTSSVLNLLDTDGVSGDDKAGFRFQMPSEAKVVRKGSFTVWTVPEDPEPTDKFYVIVIQIKLPGNVRRYRVSDLDGIVIGTDRYRQVLPWDRSNPDFAKTMRNGKLVVVHSRSFLPIKDHQVQLLIYVPPAEKLVRDRIEIRSRVLKEQHTLEIVF